MPRAVSDNFAIFASESIGDKISSISNKLGIFTGFGQIFLCKNAFFLQRNKILTNGGHIEYEVMLRTEEVVAQKEEIITQLDAIEGQNKRIKQSIRAAKTIQDAILPFDVLMQKMLREYFVIYRPKDVVSGDFYWLGQVKNKRIVSVIDCTGHGIPGAFMSMIGFTMLNDIISVNQVTDPAKILEELRRNIRYTLRQDETGGRNGMDIGLITIEDISDDQVKVCFAGAKRPLWYIEKDSTETQEIEGSNVSIGIRYRKGRHIKTESFVCTRGTLLYLSTDGFPDQNNVQRKRLGSRTLMNLLFQNCLSSLDRQKKALEDSLELYMRDTDQRDDILLIGIFGLIPETKKLQHNEGLISDLELSPGGHEHPFIFCEIAKPESLLFFR